MQFELMPWDLVRARTLPAHLPLYTHLAEKYWLHPGCKPAALQPARRWMPRMQCWESTLITRLAPGWFSSQAINNSRGMRLQLAPSARDFVRKAPLPCPSRRTSSGSFSTHLATAAATAGSTVVGTRGGGRALVGGNRRA
jgi:hypothetical protein